MSSNSVFLFILGLTVGLLISMTLLSRYHRYHPDFVVKDLPTEVMTQQGMAKKFAGPSSLQGNMQPDSTPKSEQALPVPKKSDNMKIDSTETKSSASFWIPGREGAFVKSKSPGGSAPSSSSGIDLIADFFGGSGKETNGEENQDSFSGVGKNRRNNGRKNNASGGGSDSQQGADEESESNSERMSAGGPGNGNGKRRKGPKGSRGRDAQDSAITSVLPPDPSPSAIENATALMKRFFVHVAPSGNFAADDISMQSRFFNDKGDRVDAMGGEGGEGVMLYDHPPLQPYHSQAHLKHPLPRPYAPSLASVIAQRAAMLQDNDKPLTSKPKSYYSTSLNATPKALPNMALQKGVFESDNLKLHLCNSVYEAYSGSYLTTKTHMLTAASEVYNLTWVNCEMASFVHMKESRKMFSTPQGDGMIVQSLDVLDFSVIHLSAFERSSNRYRYRLYDNKDDQNKKWTDITAVKEAARKLELQNNPKYAKMNVTWSDESKRTVAIMPFLGGAMGAGHSVLGNRFEYLKACFWSLYEFIPNIVAGVSRQEDVDWCMNESGLPFYDVILLENLPKGASLPVATTQRTKQLLISGKWKFDYVFFTESDQILISRTLPMMYDHLNKYPGRMIVPHRLMPYSKEMVTKIHKRDPDSIKLNDWMSQSCCMERQNCQNRKTWVEITDPSVGVMNYYGLYVPLGNINFLTESYRACRISPYIGDYCP